jgi:hypothetical protein
LNSTVLLKDHPHVALIGTGVGDVPPVEADPSARRFLEAGDHTESRGLSTAGGAKERDEFTCLDVEVEILDRGVGAELLANVIQCEKGHQTAFFGRDVGWRRAR